MTEPASSYKTEFLDITSINVTSIPKAITSSPFWMLWQPHLNAEKSKVIKKPLGGAKWQSKYQPFEQNLKNYTEAHKQYPTGLGFVFNTEHPFVCVDLDDLSSDNLQLQSHLNSYTETSPSGDGTHIIVQLMTLEDKERVLHDFGQKKFDKTNKRDLFISSGYVTFTGNHVASSPKDIRIMSYSELYNLLAKYFNPKIVTLSHTPVDVPAVSKAQKRYTAEQVRLMLRKVDVKTLTSDIFERLTHPTEMAILDPEEHEEARGPWLIICQGVHHNFRGEPEGLFLLHEWSAKGDKYSKEGTISVYQSFSTEPQFLNQSRPVTIASLIALISAQQPDFSDRSSKGVPLATIQNLETYFKFYKYHMRYNVISDQVNVDMPKTIMDSLSSPLKTLSDIDTVHRIVSSELLKLNMATGNFVSLRNSILDYAQLNTYNPIEDYFKSLTNEYDPNEDPIKDLMETIIPEKSMCTVKFKKAMYWFIRKWLIQVVAAAHTSIDHSDRMFNNVLIFTGPQGAGKTKWVMSLFPKKIKTYCAGSGSLRVNQFRSDSVKQALELQRTLISNINEIDQLFNRKNYSAFKQMLDENTSTMVLPYGRAATTMTRRTVFVGSTNKSNFLVDQTGNRRFTIIPIESLDYNHSVDLKQLWAQAVSWYNAGENWWLDFADPKENAACKMQASVNNRNMFMGDENLLEDLDTYFDLFADKPKYTAVTFRAVRNAIPGLGTAAINSRAFKTAQSTFISWLKTTKYGEVLEKGKGPRAPQFYLVPPLISGTPLQTFRQLRKDEETPTPI